MIILKTNAPLGCMYNAYTAKDNGSLINNLK